MSEDGQDKVGDPEQLQKRHLLKSLKDIEADLDQTFEAAKLWQNPKSKAKLLLDLDLPVGTSLRDFLDAHQAKVQQDKEKNKASFKVHPFKKRV